MAKIPLRANPELIVALKSMAEAESLAVCLLAAETDQEQVMETEFGLAAQSVASASAQVPASAWVWTSLQTPSTKVWILSPVVVPVKVMVTEVEVSVLDHDPWLA